MNLEHAKEVAHLAERRLNAVKRKKQLYASNSNVDVVVYVGQEEVLLMRDVQDKSMHDIFAYFIAVEIKDIDARLAVLGVTVEETP